MRLKDYEQLLGLLKENSKLIRRNIEKIILDKEKKTRNLLEQLYPELDEDSQNWTRQLFKYWDNSHASASKTNSETNRLLSTIAANISSSIARNK